MAKVKVHQKYRVAAKWWADKIREGWNNPPETKIQKMEDNLAVEIRWQHERAMPALAIVNRSFVRRVCVRFGLDMYTGVLPSEDMFVGADKVYVTPDDGTREEVYEELV